MAHSPHRSAWVQRRDVRVQIQRGAVVAVLVAQGRHKTRLVARVRATAAATAAAGVRRRAVAHLAPQEMAALAAAAAKEEVVVDLVVHLGARAVVHGGRRALERNGDRGVARVGEDVPAQAVGVPAEAGRVVQRAADVEPAARVRRLVVRVGRHARQRQHGRLVADVGAGERVDGPVERAQRGGLACRARGTEQRLEPLRSSVAQPFDVHGARADQQRRRRVADNDGGGGVGCILVGG